MAGQMPMDMQHVAYIALGSNLGDRETNLRQAVKRLRAIDGGTITAQAEPKVYAAAGGRPGQPDYLNSVLGLATPLSPFALLGRLQEIEVAMGRPAPADRRRGEDRVIDLDLLLFDQAVIATQLLVVPHPRMHRRRFVLEPLAAIAPDAVHPVYGLTAAQLLERL